MKRRSRFRGSLALVSVVAAAAVSGCWDISSPLRTGIHPALLADHRTLLGDAFHSSGYCDPLTSCARCHGDSLQGGPRGEPSCTSCHADVWSAGICGTSSHTVLLGGYRHAPGYCLPYGSCIACHGADLRGGSRGEPSCYECHGARWTDCGD